MPALEACCRKWEFGSDDLVFPGSISFSIRVVWLLSTAVAVGYFREALGCHESQFLKGFTVAVIAVLVWTIALEGAIVFFSARGSIVKPKPRWPIKHLLHVRLVAFLCEALLLVIGTAFAFGSAREGSRDLGSGETADNSSALLPSTPACPTTLQDAYTLVRVIALVDWAALGVLVLFTLVYLDPCRCYSSRVDPGTGQLGVVDPEAHWRHAHRTWERRFRLACCAIGSDDSHQLAYREVAQLFAQFFGDMNVVMSDIAAGLVLLQKQHLARRHERSAAQEDEEVQESGRVPLDLGRHQDRAVFETALHFSKYALAVYSWPLYAYMNPLCGCMKLYRYLACVGTQLHVVGDNCCSCYLAGVRGIAGLDSSDDIVYASFANDIYQCPFFVALDHDRRSVVVSLRGTLSMGDVITDLLAFPDPIELQDTPQFSAHKGMLQTARWVHGKLNAGDVLEAAFLRAPGYGLVIVGHSLGSGCASILGLLLRPRYPDLRCFCYSPPGAVINERGATYMEEFVTCITLGQDLVSCANIHTFKALKDDLVHAIEQSKKPKFRILLEGGLETTCWCFGKGIVFEDPAERCAIEEEALIGTPPCGQHTTHYNLDPEGSLGFTPIIVKDLAENREPLEQLYMPGRVIHLVDVGDRRGCCGGERILVAYWAPRTQFDRIQVTPDMIRDHFPDVLFAAMRTVWKDLLAPPEAI